MVAISTLVDVNLTAEYAIFLYKFVKKKSFFVKISKFEIF